MSVSSHLNPEPERRLWIIHESLKRTLEWTDIKLWALAFFAALELTAACYVLPPGAARAAVLALLAASLPVSALALTPFLETPPRMPLADPARGRPHPGDTMLAARDLAKYPQIELVNILDRYLGGGVTATPYYEDIVGQIVLTARVITRKNRVLAAAGTLAVLAQIVLLIGTISGRVW